MAKKNEILNGIHQVIDESINGVKASEKNFGLKKIINECMSNGRPEILHILQKFDTALSEGVDEILLVRPLLENLSKYESLFDVIKKNCDSLREIVNENLEDINLSEMFESIEDDAIKNYLGVVFESYMDNKTLENKASLVALLESVIGYDKNAARLMGYVKDNVIAEGPNCINSYVDVNESQVIDYKGQKFVQDRNGRLHAINATTMDEIYENVDKYIEQRIEDSKAEKEAQRKIEESKDYRKFDSGIHLAEHVRNLQNTFPKNENLQNILGEYASALMSGCREEMLYETFVQRMEEGFDYLVPVENSINSIKEACKENKTKICLVKLLEIMSNTNWASWVPIIEGVVVDYIENPNPQTRSILLNHLRMYESCPYVVDIMLCVNAQGSLGRENALSETISLKDNAKFISEHAHTENVYSPVQYVKENECIFNVENIYYVRKGSNITKLSKDAVNNLSESFLSLSILVNDPHVEIDENEDCIKYYTSDSVVEIHESVAKIGDKFFDLEELKNINEMSVDCPDMDEIDFLTSAFLMENFNNIAKIDFVTKISMNENENKTLDLFRIKDNIFVSSHDNVNEEHIFYRNVKPLQLKNIINEHFGMKVSNLFEELMPNQDKIMNEINELRNSYEEKIQNLLEMKQQMQDAMESVGESEKSQFAQSIDEIDFQLSEAKKDYKKFQKKAEEIERGKDCDNDAPVLNEEKPKRKKKVNEEEDDIDIDFDVDFDGSDNDIEDIDFSEFEEDGSDDGIEDIEDVVDGSDEDFDNDEYTTSDGDDMTVSIESDGSDEDVESFETDPFSEDGSDEDVDFSDNNSQGIEDYSIEGEEVENDEDFDMGDDGVDSTDVITAEEDPFNVTEEDVEGDDELEGETEGGVEDAVTGEPEQRTDDTADDADLDYVNFKIVKVDFDINVRTGEKKSTGKAIVVVPWIDDFGNKTSETKTIPFYVADIQGEKGVVLNTAGMSVEMYNAVTSAIKNSADFDTVEVKKQEDDVPEDVVLGGVPEEIHIEDGFEDEGEFDPMRDDNYSEPFDSGSDETTVITMDDGIEPRGINTPTYMDGDTEIDLPANNISLSDSPVIDIVGETKNVSKSMKSVNESNNTTKVDSDPFESLFETVVDGIADGVEEVKDTNGDGSNLVAADYQEDPIAVIEDVLVSFEEEMSEDDTDNIDIDIEVGDIEDYDIDGTEVSSIKAIIGENEYAFFTVDDKVYSCLAEQFDENSEDIDTLREFVESDDENLAVCEGSDTESVVALVTDVISIETGEDFVYNIEGDEETDDIEEEIEKDVEYKEKNDLESENF